jgi:MoCo/4Fe-4S cofactor protein with predicted Tat translocation signal
MKRIFHHPPEHFTGKKYWRSLEELADTPEVRSWLQCEFPDGAADLEMDGVSRRNFLRVMGASLALAGVGLSGCRRPTSYIVPYTKSVEWLIPGKAVLYTTSIPGVDGGMPLIATTYEGRPTKLEGNPLVPNSSGGTDAFTQAAILELYDPERARAYIKLGEEATAEEFAAYFKTVQTELQSNHGAGFAILLDEQFSPTRDRLLTALKQQFPQVGIFVDEPLGFDQVYAAADALLGAGALVRPDFSNADVIVSLDADFLGLEMTLEGARNFSARRRAHGSTKNMNRLYAVENRYTVTGGMADHRLRCGASQIPAFAVALARKVATATNDRALGELVNRVKDSQAQFDDVWLSECAKDLVERKGRSVVLLGQRYPAWIQGVVLTMNNALGAFGSTLRVWQAPRVPAGTLADLASAIKAGTVKRLFILGGNPGYTAPVDLNWAELQRSVPEVVRLSYYHDETAESATWSVPAAHFLEFWSDQRSTDGAYLPIQPMIMPLFGGLSQIDLLAQMVRKSGGIEAVRETFKTFNREADFETGWTALLRHGFARDSGYQGSSQAFNADALPGLLEKAKDLPPAPNPSALEVVFPGDYSVKDGRHTNNAWLQEMPDPITKLTWDNAMLVSPTTAGALQVADKDLVEVTVGNRKLEAAIMVAPGHADYSLTISLGYGRDAVGRVGRGTGFNGYNLRTSDALYYANGATVRLIKKNGYHLVQPQQHYSMEGRNLVREGTVEDYTKDPAFAQTIGMDADIPPNISLYSHPPMNAPNQWGMVVDLNTCTGCSACVMACQAENNVPVVGKDQVDRFREMQWIRIDRYFASADGDQANPHLAEDPEMVTQPMMCQHCENAPCETVCPVNATVHSEEGLNVMVYNRCIGTRYCSNNCPFKVRRFNFFNYNDRPVLDRIEHGAPGFQGKQQLYLGPLARWGMDEISKMQKNPNVTVRMRGVMEKCTYCVQRIETAKISQRIKAGIQGDLSLPTDSVKSACQQVCPTEAIVFGDIKDAASQVSRLRALPQNYHLLKYLNIKTRTTYLARVRNPNPKMPGAAKVGKINGGHEEEEQEGAPPRAEAKSVGGNA